MTNISYQMARYPPTVVLDRQHEYKLELERTNHHYFKMNVPTSYKVGQT